MAEVKTSRGLVRVVTAADAHTAQPATQEKEVKKGKERFQASTFEQLEQDFQEVRILLLCGGCAMAARTRVSPARDALRPCLPPATQVLQELVGDQSLERFRQEYEKLHRALKKSNEGEKRLLKKCRELNSEIVSNAVKVQTALRLSQEDQDTIGSLKRVRAAGTALPSPPMIPSLHVAGAVRRWCPGAAFAVDGVDGAGLAATQTGGGYVSAEGLQDFCCVHACSDARAIVYSEWG
jgi:hypothetical protein